MQRHQNKRGILNILGFTIAAAISTSASAALYTWDAGSAGGNGSHSSSPQDGAGTWSTTNLNWTTTGSGADVGWTNSTSNNAMIGSNNNTVSGVQTITMGAAMTLGNLTFGTVNGGSYNIAGISGNNLAMTGGTPTITVNPNVTAEIDAPISVTGSQPNVTIAGSGTLNLNPAGEGSNYHGLILGGTTDVVIQSAAAAGIAIPNNTTGAVFSGGTLSFAATPSVDVSGRFSNTSGAKNIGVTNGALVTFGSPLGGTGGFNVFGSGSGSTIKLTESGSSQVGFNGSGGVTVTGATLYLTGNHNNELGSNAVTVNATGILSSDSTKLVTSGATTVNGTITGGSGNLSTDTFGNMHLSATTFGSTGGYDWKLNTAPVTAYNSGAIVNSVLTANAANANSGTNFDTLFMSSLTDITSGFDINLIPSAGSGTALIPGATYEFAIANTATGAFNTTNFTYTGFTLASVADSTLSAANNGGFNSQLNNGTGQDLILSYTVPSVPEPTSVAMLAIATTALMARRRSTR